MLAKQALLSILGESISNASFGIYMPRFAGTIYEILSAPISSAEMDCKNGDEKPTPCLGSSVQIRRMNRIQAVQPSYS